VVRVLARQAPQVRDAGVVDEDVDAPVLGDHRHHHVSDSVGIGHVGGMHGDPAAVALPQPGRVLLQQILRTSGQRDVRAGLGQGRRT
jgi:hypothetical protein